MAYKNDPTIACNLAALNDAQRKRRAELVSRLRSVVREMISTSDGLEFRVTANENTLGEVAEFISLERRCCPFLNFRIDWTADDDLLRLQLGGCEGVKEFLAAEFGIEQNPKR
jgi:hypothetical protein